MNVTDRHTDKQPGQRSHSIEQSVFENDCPKTDRCSLYITLHPIHGTVESFSETNYIKRKSIFPSRYTDGSGDI